MTVPLRVVLLAVVAVVAISVALVSFIPLFLFGEETGKEFSTMVREEISTKLAAQTSIMFTPYHGVVDAVSTFARFAADLDFGTNNATLPATIAVTCDGYVKTKKSTFIGLPNGYFVGCVPSYGSSVPYVAKYRNTTHQVVYDVNSTFHIVNGPHSLTEVNYVATARPWYHELLPANGYSALYRNFSRSGGASTTVITAGGPIYTRNGALVGVFAIDVFPKDVIEHFAQNVKVAKTGHALLVEEGSTHVLGSDLEIPQLGEDLVALENITTPTEGQTTDFLAAAVVSMQCETPCSTKFGRRRGSGHVGAVDVEQNSTLRLRVLVVTFERDFLGDFYSRSDIAIIVLVICFVLLLAGALGLTHFILSPLSDLSQRIRQMAMLTNLESAVDESIFTELNDVQLALIEVLQEMGRLKAFIPQNMLTIYGDDGGSHEFDEDWDIEEGGKGNPSASDTDNPLGENPSLGKSQQNNSSTGDDSSPELQRKSSMAIGMESVSSLGLSDFKLNTKRMAQMINNFTLRRCSVLVAELAIHRCGSKAEIQESVTTFVEALIPAVLDNRGVIEVFRPEIIVASFTAVMHETKAVNCLIDAARGVHKLGNYVSLVVDSGEYYTGNIGARERYATVLAAPMLATLRKIPDLITCYKGTVTAISEATALNAKNENVTLFHVDTVQPRFSKMPLRLFDIAPFGEFHCDQHRAGLMHLLNGETAEARLAFEEADDNPHSHRLAKRPTDDANGKLLMSETGIVLRREVFPWEDLGDLRGSSDAKYEAFRDRFGAGLSKDALGASSSNGDVRAVGAMLASAKEALQQAKASIMEESFEDNGLFSFIPTKPLATEEDDDDTSGTVEATVTDIHNQPWSRSEMVLGSGAYGAVYLGMNDSGLLAALKVLKLQVDMNTADLETETRALIELQHENVVQYISAAVTKHSLFLILEYVPGGSLANFMANCGGKFSTTVAKKYARDVLSGLAYLHSENVIHCDIKPHNVLLSADGTCKLTDFGSAIIGESRTNMAASVMRGTQESNTSDTNVRGTVKYMAPEVADGLTPTSASDVWSFGITLTEMICGKLPYEHLRGISSLKFMSMLGEGTVGPKLPYTEENFPLELVQLIESCWQREAHLRPSAQQLLNQPFFS